MTSPVIGLIIQLVGYLLKAYGAKQASLDAYAKLVAASQNDGLISIDTKDVFLAQEAELSLPPKS